MSNSVNNNGQNVKTSPNKFLNDLVRRSLENMEMQHNSRQIPSNKQYTANKQYSDLVYGYLQQKSMLDEKSGVRFLLKKDVKFVQIARDLDLSRQTVSRKINNLIEEGLLYYDEKNKIYILTKLEAELAALMPCDTVRILCVNLKERSLSVLAYLIKTYIQHYERPFEVNLDIMKEQVGLNVDNRGNNNQIIKDIFVLLKTLGLIEYRAERELDIDTGGFKTRYVIEQVNNKVRFC